MISKTIPCLFLMLVLFTACKDRQKDKHPDLKYFPEFNGTSKNVHLEQLGTDDEDICRVYPSKDQKRLVVISRLINEDPKNYRLQVYDTSLKLLKKIDAPELDGLFGQDELDNIYAGKGYFEHGSYQYRPIIQMKVTDRPSRSGNNSGNESGNGIEIDKKTFLEMPERGDTVLSFQRKDYSGLYYYMKKSGKVYQIFFKDCAYCESQYNRDFSISEYRAADNGTDQIIRPYDLLPKGWFQEHSIYYYQIKFEKEELRFKISYADESQASLLKKIDFGGKSFLFYKKPGQQNRKLYFFKTE
ncbi:hypothetical protein SAMN04488522_103684 [Pedobacter caeni]|uniref:Uncharacterized protein n=1 Tax=Pedobacter caeni TaxID=288992 RepID=A0A1M5EKE6_9SPHI|nr:hypothetical protein SAMN04488522_103684 [Pedobacter caeni]